jgi:hypothetical protein
MNDTSRSYRIPFALALLGLATSSAPARAGLGPLVRDAQGNPVSMFHDAAVQHCRDQGGLPTVRQLAEELYPGSVSDLPLEGYAPVWTVSGEVDFYYKGVTYGMGTDPAYQPTDDSGWIYSRTPYTIRNDLTGAEEPAVYQFAGHYGGIGPDLIAWPSFGQVRCARP